VLVVSELSLMPDPPEHVIQPTHLEILGQEDVLRLQAAGG
jgi:hypothetical protein